MDSKPKLSDTEYVEKNKHISNEEILRDIQDTRDEISQLEKEIKGYVLIGDRMSMFIAQGKRYAVKERLEFVGDLTHLLELRSTGSTQSI